MVSAEPVTITTDREGRKIYQAGEWLVGEEADLPPVRREPLADRIQGLKAETPETCVNRGGIDCTLGADPSDGSAICRDGFRDVALSFIAACSSVRLEISKVRFFAERQELSGDELRPVEYGGTLPDKILIHLRNLSDVAAKGVEVNAEIVKRRFNAMGSAEIAPFALEEYTFIVDRNQLPPFADFRKSYRTRVSCKNCTAVRTGRY